MATRRLFQLKHGQNVLKVTSGTLSIGRLKTCDLVVDDARVSRKHARIIIGEASAAIEDLGSANGVLVNGQRIQSLCVLRAGDRIEIGRMLIEVIGYGDEARFPPAILEDEKTIVDDRLEHLRTHLSTNRPSRGPGKGPGESS
jgi:pSer/pThr/pTyr-binding forkhead associated (FHA) protein